MLIGTVIVWYALMNLGWYLVFASHADSVIKLQDEASSTLLEKLYFTGVTLSGLGYGDFVPSRFPWTLFGNYATLSATLVITTSLSYLLQVVSSAVEKKALAETIFAIGRTPGGIDSYVLTTLGQLGQHSHQHLAYPILNFFHSRTKSKSSSRAILVLSDAVFLMRHFVAKEDRPPACCTSRTRRSATMPSWRRRELSCQVRSKATRKSPTSTSKRLKKSACDRIPTSTPAKSSRNTAKPGGDSSRWRSKRLAANRRKGGSGRLPRRIAIA
ncbi:Ion channel [Stratiformator vulcanicus]|uniref:Ion channel n=1 Tax=Stratiformator vulcanicus TaxID=2527980 RepID=A0A517R4W7_9PLAN|nr:Ion channel [Stratiformator vulcanicus]